MRVLQRTDRAVLLDVRPPAVHDAHHHIVHMEDPPVPCARKRLVQLISNLLEVYGRERADLYLKKPLRQLLGLGRRLNAHNVLS